MSLVANNLVVSLGRRTVLSDVSIAIAPGEMTAVVGPNGAGKSSLLKALAGLLKPAAGSVSLDGRSLAELSHTAVAREIAYLPQERTVSWPITVRGVVELGRLPHRAAFGTLRPADEAAVAAALGAMDLSGLEARPVTAVSGGELARTLVARALAQQTAIILADEPTAGLDPAHQLCLFERLARLRSEGRSIVVALHDLSLAARYCDRIVLLKDGRLVADGPPDAVLTPKRMASAYGIKARLVHIDGLPLVITASELHGPPA